VSTAPSEWQVLVIEDEPHGMELMRDILAYHGIHTQGVTSAEEALEALTDMSPTLVLVDLALPGMDGWAFLKEVLKDQRFKLIPFVAVTAYHSAGMAAKAAEAGFTAFFPKPLNALTFVNDLESIVQTKLY